MNLYIMTRGRIGAQRTWQSIPASWRDRATLVVPMDEFNMHGDIPTFAVPRNIDNYSKKMEFIVNDGMSDGEQKAVILDDDLIFSRRITHPDGRPGLKTLEGQEIQVLMPELFSYIEYLLDDTALVGVHPRQFGHTQELPFKRNGKVICVQAINRSLVGAIPDLSKYPILADVVLNATLLSRGIGNKIVTSFCQDWGPSQAPGGCALYRTPEMQADACRWLEERFGPYIKVKEKEAKNGWLGGKRVDFVGQWQKLYEAGAAGLLDQREGRYTSFERIDGPETVDE
jgi:hypothetical protein